MINEAEERRQFKDWLREELPGDLQAVAEYAPVREAWWVVWKGCAQKKADQAEALRDQISELELEMRVMQEFDDD